MGIEKEPINHKNRVDISLLLVPIISFFIAWGTAFWTAKDKAEIVANRVAARVANESTASGLLARIEEFRQNAEKSFLTIEDFRRKTEETVQVLEQRKSEQENFKNELQKLSIETQQQAKQAVDQSNQALARKLVLGEEKELSVPSDCKQVEVVLGPAKDNSFAFITYVMGKFEGGGERVWIEKRSDSWVLCASACQREVMVKARCAWIE